MDSAMNRPLGIWVQKHKTDRKMSRNLAMKFGGLKVQDMKKE
jgi:hypothetical protein